MYSKNLDGQYTRVNQAFLDAVGATSFNDVLGTTSDKFFSPETSAEIRLLDQDVLTGQPQRDHKHVVRFKNRGTRIFRGSKLRSTTLAKDGTITPEVIGVYFDVTDEQRSKRFAMFESIVKCVDHDYVQCFLKNISSNLSSDKTWDELNQYRELWTTMTSMATGFLARLRWLDRSVRPAGMKASGDRVSVAWMATLIESLCESAGLRRPALRIDFELSDNVRDVIPTL